MILMDIIRYVILLVIAVLAYKVMTNFITAKKNRRFQRKDFLLEDEQPEEIKGFSKYTSLTKYRESIEQLFNKVGYEMTFKHFMLKRAVAGAIPIIVCGGLALYTEQSLFVLLALPVAIIMFNRPVSTMKKFEESQRVLLKREFLDYQYHFVVLLIDHTPLDTVMKSVQYAGPNLKEHAVRFAKSLALTPSSKQPFKEFAENTRLRETKEFVITLEQIMKVDSNQVLRIVKDQIQSLKELQEETYIEIVEERPAQVETIVNIMLLPFFGVIFMILASLILDMF